jgi:hypothetical protein
MTRLIQDSEPLRRVKWLAGKPGERYMPANGTDGECFHAQWCERCARDKVMNGEATTEQADADPSLYCDILTASFVLESLEQWVYGDDGQPRCTQFVAQGTDLPAPRCPNTLELPLDDR